jgi:hypothetical protein
MRKTKKLTKKQLGVIADLFAGELDEQHVLDKYDVSRDTFEKWLNDERFIGRLNERIAHSFWQSRLFIARYAPLAAARLVGLTASETQETARKACLDIISTDPQGIAGTPVVPVKTPSHNELSPETTSRILAALAEER